MNEKSTIWQLGFRPFFLFASLLSAIYMLVWLGMQAGVLPAVRALSPMIWHAHEMLFGFSTAIIAGFVLTASQNWSGIRGVRGKNLQFLVFLWLLGRILILFSPEAGYITALVDLGFLPATGYFLWPYFKDIELKTERIFFIYFFMLMSANALVHAEALGLTGNTARKGLHLGLHTIVLIVLFIGGRVIPFFTESNTSKYQPRSYPKIEFLSHVGAWLFLATQLFIPNSMASTVIAFMVGVTNLIRLIGWQVPRVRKVPIIWILHLSYFWIVIGFFMTGFASLGIVSNSVCIHSFTVGGLGGIIYGMISRVSLGHTGRRLLPRPLVVWGYILMSLAGFIRVGIPIFFPKLYAFAIYASGTLWVIAFGIFILTYWQILLNPRIDGKTG